MNEDRSSVFTWKPGDIILLKKGKQELFAQGGPGSGHFDHRGRPGKVGGSSKSGTAPDVRREDDEDDLDLLLKATKDAVREGIEEDVDRILNALGYPSEKVEVNMEMGPTFYVNGIEYTTGADYDPSTGQIRIFNAGSKSITELEGQLAHEVQHSRWNEYKKSYQEQATQIWKKKRDGKDLLNEDGTLKSEKDKEKFWAYTINESFLLPGPRWERLKKADGISNYSRAYWRQANNSGSSWDYDRAVDETLAEIARIEVGSHREGDKKSVRPIWRSLYTKVNKKTIKKNQRLLFHFGGPGSGYKNHPGRPGEVGGSKKRGSGARFTDTDPISGKKTKVVFSEEEKDTINRIVESVQDFYDIESPIFLAGQATGTEFGHHGNIKGEHYIWISTDKIKEALDKGSLDFKEWSGITDDSYDSVLSHIVAHEIGHAWWDTHSIKSKELVRLPSGNKGIIETNPMLLEWRDSIYPKNRQKFSGYSRYHGSYKEAFMDEFAKYANGEPMDSDIEEWFLKNVE